MSVIGTEQASQDPSARRRPVGASPAAVPGAEPPLESAVAGAPRARGRWTPVAAKVAPPAIAAVAMTVLGLWGLARDSALSNDEAATSIAARLSLSQLANLLRHIDIVHGVYYLLMHGWAAIGTSPAALRIPSVIAMIAAAAMIAVLATMLSGSGWAGLFAGLTMAVTPSISFYGQTARSYALVYACVVGATLALVAALRTEIARAGAAERASIARTWLPYVGLIALGGYLNEMSLLVLAAHGVTVLLSRSQRVVLRRWALAGALGAVLVAPLGLASVLQHSDVSWIGPPNLTALRILCQDYFAVTPLSAAIVIACMIVALLPGNAVLPSYAVLPSNAVPEGDSGAAGIVGARWWQGGISLPSVALPLLIVPALLLISESYVIRPLYVDRYVLYGEAGAALLAGAGLYRIGLLLAARLAWLRTVTARRWVVLVPGLIVCVALLPLQIRNQERSRTPQSRLYDFTAPARYVGANARPGDGVLFFDSFFRKDELIYPGDFRNTDDFGEAESPALAGTFRGIDKPFAAQLPLILAHRRIWVVGLAPSPSLPATLLQQQSMTLMRYFTLVTERQFRGIDVTLWVRRR
jgi:mannosyltransferase